LNRITSSGGDPGGQRAVPRAQRLPASESEARHVNAFAALDRAQ
jgi:hypothetical protein